MLNLIRIDEAQRNTVFHSDFYPPQYGPDFDRAAFLAEWGGVLDRVCDTLTAHWTRTIAGEGDFHLSIDYPSDRIILIEVVSRRMLDRRVVPLLYEVLRSSTPPYLIAMCNSSWFLETESGDPYPDFNFFLTPDAIRLYAEDDSVAVDFGF